MKKSLNILLLSGIFICVIFPHKLHASWFYSKVDSFNVFMDQNQLVLPGESFKIKILSYRKNKVRKNFGLWKYKVEVVGGKRRGNTIFVNKQLTPSKGKYLEIKVYPRKQTRMEKSLLIPLNYETTISFLPTNIFDKAPGCTFKGKIIAKFNNGAIRIYNKLQSKKESEIFVFKSMGGIWHNGSYTIEPDFTKIENHRIYLYVNSNLNPSISDTFSVLLDYKHNYHLSLRGSSGSNGFSGSGGNSGSSGSDGGDGGYGQDGEYGYDGPEIGVWTDLYYDSTLNSELLYVYAQDLWSNEEYKYLVNPLGGKLSVASLGGSGGRGGDGGDGGDGGNGSDGRIWYETKIEKRIEKKPFTEKRTKKVKKTVKDENDEDKEIVEDVEYEVTVYKDVEVEVKITIKHQEPGEDGGDAGNGGGAGFGGAGGFGGNIYLYFTKDAWKYENTIHANSIGGSGGWHGDGGDGGSGGRGGQGNPSGSCGSSGYDGPSAFGISASDGRSGKISKRTTEEFFFYIPNDELQSQIISGGVK